MDKENKYKNPDKRCTYPYDKSPVGYCWAYANHIDRIKGFSDIGKKCKKCEYFEALIEEDWDVDSRSVTVQDTQQERS